MGLSASLGLVFQLTIFNTNERRARFPFQAIFSSLFVAESDHGVNLHGAARGNKAGQDCYGS
jgi:hypothetical protein